MVFGVCSVGSVDVRCSVLLMYVYRVGRAWPGWLAWRGGHIYRNEGRGGRVDHAFIDYLLIHSIDFIYNTPVILYAKGIDIIYTVCYNGT